jgi:hypothetical protein
MYVAVAERIHVCVKHSHTYLQCIWRLEPSGMLRRVVSLYDAVSQEALILILAAVRTWNLTQCIWLSQTVTICTCVMIILYCVHTIVIENPDLLEVHHMWEWLVTFVTVLYMLYLFYYEICKKPQRAYVLIYIFLESWVFSVEFLIRTLFFVCIKVHATFRKLVRHFSMK